MNNFNKPTAMSLAPCFLHLAAIISLDPEDQEPEQLKRAFEAAIKAHDFFYEMSDDASVYNRGKQELSIIERAAREHTSLMKIWKAFCEMKGGRIA